MLKQDKSNQTAAINTKAIIVGMILMSIIVHIGFGATYIKHFPVFQEYNWLHHIHGALMGAWVMLLVVQPFFIHFKKFETHRLLGKLSYAIAPCMLVSMLFIARYNYESGIPRESAADIMAGQSITWMQIGMFVLFYSLAIYFRRNTFFHMRFMIGTAIIMLGPAMNRLIFSYFPGLPVTTILLIALYVKTGLAAALFFSDIIKKNNWRPYGIVFSAFLFSDVVFHARYSDAWQAVGRFIVNAFY